MKRATGFQACGSAVFPLTMARARWPCAGIPILTRPTLGAPRRALALLPIPAAATLAADLFDAGGFRRERSHFAFDLVQ